MRPAFDEKWFFGAVKQQLDESRRGLQSIVDANPTKSPSSFSYSHKDRLKNFPIDLGGDFKLSKRRYVRIVRRACRQLGWYVVVRGNLLKATLRGDRL